MSIRQLVSVLTLLAGTVLMVWASPAQAKKSKKKAAETDTRVEEAEQWDVDAPPGPHHDVAIDVKQGTWMNLDVSPDGREVVFDLLGDLYSVPLEGGEAKVLTSGLAWDMQPRFSPDARHIAFTSDRGGGDNVWILDREAEAGSESRLLQVTREDFRLVNDPVWSPDGDFLAVRKHFTGQRSLGAGEIWLYHRTGGQGLQVTQRQNEQKDLGEPAFSPDGRYVWFSRDSTPGRNFRYNKDPNAQIYTIHRLDRLDGDVETFVAGPGGAACPTPSPDGKKIAFVRRLREKTALYVQDLESGRNRLVFDRLERDMQETWAIHGVYPNMAWTPDSRWIVFWAAGRIFRVSVETRELVDVPFHVRQTHAVAEALRFPVDVAPETFDVRMLRWVRVSPRGDRVVYQALGHLWVANLDDEGALAGEPRRLTDQNDHFEFYPSFSNDGQNIVYTSWNDDALGAVRVVDAAGGEGAVITEKPGHYMEPVFSPDATLVVYRKGRGGFVRSPLYSREGGLYKVPAKGGDSVRISKHGARPHFANASDRLFFMVSNAEVDPSLGPEDDSRSLRSIGLGEDLASRGELIHVSSTAAAEMHVSPDGRWLAFAERFKVYVSPFPLSGRTVELGPKTQKVPIRQVARDAGDGLHWSGDGQSLYWSLGPELYRRAVSDAFAFLEGAPEELPEPLAEGTPIGFSVPTDSPSGKIALTGARIVTMHGDEVIEEGTVVVEGSRILAVGPSDSVEVPAHAHHLDVTGSTIIPGIVDVHWHGRQGSDEITPQRNWYNYASLAFGVTTAHDPSTDTSTFFAAAEMAGAGLITAPRLFSTGTVLYGAAGEAKSVVDSLEDARSHLRRMKAVGAISVKSYNQPRRDQRQQIVTAARELEMMVVPEGGSLFYHNMTMMIDGHTGIEHSLPVPEVYDDVLQLWSGSRTGYTPTMGVAYGGISGERYWYQHTNVWEHERLLSFVPRFMVDPVARRRAMAPEEEYNHIQVARVSKKLSDVGVKVNVGAHGQREGLASHWEMWMLAQGGMTPHEALRAATWNGAYYLGMDHRIGSIEAGKLADLAILAKNPLQDIRYSDSVTHVMIGGRLYDAATMDEIGHHPRPRGKFFWEDDQVFELSR